MAGHSTLLVGDRFSPCPSVGAKEGIDKRSGSLVRIIVEILQLRRPVREEPPFGATGELQVVFIRNIQQNLLIPMI